MKRAKNLYPQIISFENLLLASRKACKSKRDKPAVHDFHLNLEKNLISIQAELKDKVYKPGPYRSFIVFEQKKRVISAAPYKDRVVHHALCNVIEPLFDRRFISDSYACRKGKGQHKAIARARSFISRYNFVLKLDVQRYFPSVDHEILKYRIRKVIGDRDAIWLIDQIIDSYSESIPLVQYFPGDDLFSPLEMRKGMPIGNLTSQIFANIYLDGLDHFIKEKLRLKAYCRYVDDLVIFGNNKMELHRFKNDILAFLDDLRLRIHPKKCLISLTRDGVEFLGYRIFPHFMKVRKNTVKHFKKKLSAYQRDYSYDKVPATKISKVVESWLAHLAHGNNYKLARDLLSEFKFCKVI